MKILIGLIALGVLGVLSIHLGVTGPGARTLEARIAEAVEAALHEGGHDWARVRVEGQRAVLTGIAPTREALAAARRSAARAVSIGGPVAGGVTAVNIGEADIAPLDTAILPTARPFILRLSRSSGGLTAEGFVPDPDFERRLGLLGAGGSVQVARGMPDPAWRGLALEAAGILPEDAGLSLTDRRLVLTGNWNAASRATIADRLPPGYEVVMP
ncbi:hypothetical protein [Parvularcula oceani]|uniref:hypothetical protein n=1 Tax=Parvularcula oceani TaxID=1247963 RepID=UPI0004E1DA2F|nr:hypothetical protein [Parvularcula oceani]